MPGDRGAGTQGCLGTEVQRDRGVWGQGSGTQEYRDTGNKPRCWAINAGASSPWSPYFHSTHRFFSSFQPSVDGFPLPTPAVPGEKPPSGFGTPRLGFSQGGAGKAPKPKDLVGRGNRREAHVAPKDQQHVSPHAQDPSQILRRRGSCRNLSPEQCLWV